MEQIQLTAEVFVDTGKDFRPEDSLQSTYTRGEIQKLTFDLSCFEHTCGFRFDPLLEDSSVIELISAKLTYANGESKEIEASRIKTNADVDFAPIFVYLHQDPKLFIDEVLCMNLVGAEVEFKVLDLGIGEKAYWQDIKKHSVSEKEKEQLLHRIELLGKQNHELEQENKELKIEHANIYGSGIWKLQHDAKGPLKVLLEKGNLITLFIAIYFALCSELFIFNQAYYATARPNAEVLLFQPLRFGMIAFGLLVVLGIIKSVVQKGYRRELY